MKKIIPIDHGNRLIKTAHNVFPSSFLESKYLPSIGGDTLKYEGKSYTLVDQNLPVLNDKTEDGRYFILSLFAIGKELVEEAEMFRKLTPHDHIKVELPIGLPLQYYETYRKKFEQYFTNHSDVIKFELNGKSYAIKITGAYAFPQAYSAAITAFDKLKDSNILNIVDIGGYTVDCLQLNKFNPNMALCTSLYWGTNTLFESINDQMRPTGGRDLSNSIIEGILKKDPADLAEYSEKRIETVTSAALSHTERMLAEIAQKGFDLEEDKTVFMGGGSILLEEYIKQANKAKKPIFIDDVHANAKGYRDVRWNLKLSMEHHRQDFEEEYGMSVIEYLDDVYAACASFEGTKLEHHANSMKRTAEMLKLIDTSLHLIRENYSEGEPYYWILYYTYLSPQKLSGVDEIVDRIKSHVPFITKDTYFKQRKKAISTFASVLWGFTTKRDADLLDTFADAVGGTGTKPSSK